MPDENSYDKDCLEIVKKSYRDYVCQGASSTNPRVRLATPIPVTGDPDPIG